MNDLWCSETPSPSCPWPEESEGVLSTRCSPQVFLWRQATAEKKARPTTALPQHAVLSRAGEKIQLVTVPYACYKTSTYLTPIKSKAFLAQLIRAASNLRLFDTREGQGRFPTRRPIVQLYYGMSSCALRTKVPIREAREPLDRSLACYTRSIAKRVNIWLL